MNTVTPAPPRFGRSPEPRRLWATLRPTGIVGAAGARGRLLPEVSVQSWRDHLRRYGALPEVSAAELIALSESARLTGRGGGAFPTGRKIAAVLDGIRSGRRAVVVANCCDGDPTTGKDSALLAWAPHLVVDGAILLGRALRADRTALAVHVGSPGRSAVLAALRSRVEGSGGAAEVEVVAVPARFVASEASSLVSLINTGDARPLGRFAPIWRRGVDGAPTLVVNAETLATLALLARFGPGWHAQVGLADEPGTVLVTIAGSVPAPTVVEVAIGTPLRAVLAAAGAEPSGDALLGGLGGGSVDLTSAAEIPYSAAGLRSLGTRRGVGSIVVLPANGCLLAETVRISRYLADESAGQCGPCMFGLPAVAADLYALARGDRDALDRLRRRLPVVTGRGGCSHPDGAVGMVASALAVLTGRAAQHLSQHLRRGGCDGLGPVVPLPDGDHRENPR